MPQVGVITDIRIDTPDVKTFRVNAPDGKKLSSICPASALCFRARRRRGDVFHHLIADKQRIYGIFHQKVRLRYRLAHCMEVVSRLPCAARTATVPGGDKLKGKNLLFIAGGIGLAPLRSVINYCRHYRNNYGTDRYCVRLPQYAGSCTAYKEIIDEWIKTIRSERISHHRPRTARMGRTCRLCSDLCQGAWLRYKQNGAALRTSDNDQIYILPDCRSSGSTKHRFILHWSCA